MAKVTVKVTKRYSDVVTGKVQEVGDVLEVDGKRAEHLKREGVAADAAGTEAAAAAGQETEAAKDLGDQGKENG